MVKFKVGWLWVSCFSFFLQEDTFRSVGLLDMYTSLLSLEMGCLNEGAFVELIDPHYERDCELFFVRVSLIL